MYDAQKARIDQARDRFDREVSARSPELRRTACEYLGVLSEFIRTFNDGPAADPAIVHVDTTGQLRQAEDLVVWAEQERQRVRTTLSDLP